MHLGGQVDKREGHIHALRQQRGARGNNGVGSVVQVARILDVAAKSEEDAFARNALLVGQSSRMIASNVGSVPDVAFSVKPQCCAMTPATHSYR